MVSAALRSVPDCAIDPNDRWYVSLTGGEQQCSLPSFHPMTENDRRVPFPSPLDIVPLTRYHQWMESTYIGGRVEPRVSTTTLEPRGVVFTRPWVVELILDLAGYDSATNLVDAIVIEPAAGHGAFLLSIVCRLVASCRHQRRPVADCARSLIAYEIDPAHAAHARSEIAATLLSLGTGEADAEMLASVWVREGDYLLDAGTRGAVTGGTQMGALEVLVTDLLVEAGLEQLHVKTRTALELPGYYRPEKKWDLLIVASGQLVCAIEYKSQVGPSFGNNYNNRVEEAIGSASDIWVAFREKRLGTIRPFLGYFFLLEDCAQVHTPVRKAEPYFAIDPVFEGASYSKRYEILCERLILERLYDGACLTLATNAHPTTITHPAAPLDFRRFAAQIQGHARSFVQSQTR